MTFITGNASKVNKNRHIQGMEQYQKKKKTEELKKNDLQEKVCRGISKDYLDN